MNEYLQEVVGALQRSNLAQLDYLLQSLKEVQRSPSTRVFVAGNGGSYAVAMHWGVDLAKIAHLDITTLGSNLALLSALSNDLDYSEALSTELVIRAERPDVVIALSCSGKSPNIVSVLREAVMLHLDTFLLTGHDGPEHAGVKIIRIDSDRPDVLEDAFAMIGHYFTRKLVS